MSRDLNIGRSDAATIFAALGSEQRLQVLISLVRARPEGLAIGEFGERSGITGSTLTHHMKLVSAVGFVDRMKNGRRIICIAATFERMQVMFEFLL